jgi:hypothetical protein
MVLPQTLGGISMPDIADALDLLRFDQLKRDAEMALNLWEALRLAADRGETPIIQHHAKQLTILTRSTLALVKRLGQAEPDDARQ